MKILIQGLGEVPIPIELALKKEKPDVTYILCNKYQMKNVAKSAGYKKSSSAVIEEVAKKTGTKVVFQLCDIFSLQSVSDAIGQVIKQVKPNDEVVINYTGGAASVKLLLGATAVVLSRFLSIKIIYALRLDDGKEVVRDQTEELQEIFKQLYEFF
ncbi:MAG: hypothetical protein QMC89_05500 [Candidatus Hodarchaeaceae archaeon]|nr:hypothetical protein [Candidatus Hodarchaeaceae archaeon]